MASKRMIGRPAQQRYVASGRRETNKERKLAKAKKRIQRLMRRRDEQQN